MKSHDKIATRLALILNKFNSGEKFTIEEYTKTLKNKDILKYKILQTTNFSY